MGRLVTLGFSALLLTLSAFAQPSALETNLRNAMVAAHFEQVIDYGPYNESCPGQSFCPVPALQVAYMPNVDVAVIQLDAAGNMIDRANVLLSRDYPGGQIIPLDLNGGATSVRFPAGTSPDGTAARFPTATANS